MLLQHRKMAKVKKFFFLFEPLPKIFSFARTVRNNNLTILLANTEKSLITKFHRFESMQIFLVFWFESLSFVLNFFLVLRLALFLIFFDFDPKWASCSYKIVLTKKVSVTLMLSKVIMMDEMSFKFCCLSMSFDSARSILNTSFVVLLCSIFRCFESTLRRS